MAICMAKTIKEERLRWVLPIVSKRMRLVDAARIYLYSKRSLERWVAIYKKGGEMALEPKSTRPKTSPKETPIRIKERIVEMRSDKNKCALKIKWDLEEEGIVIHERTAGKILKNEGLTRKYRTKKIKYKYIKAERQPGELVEIDVKHVPGKLENKRYFQYTAIDTASRWRHIEMYPSESSFHIVEFLREVIRRFPYRITAVKTDNHSTFTNWYTGANKRSDLSLKRFGRLDEFCRDNDIVHYLIDPGKPAQNGTVERSHREDQEKFYDQNTFKDEADLKKKMISWNIYYNNLKHCGLKGRSPNQFLSDYRLVNPPNVCT
jgi:transposase InsO family protein